MKSSGPTTRVAGGQRDALYDQILDKLSGIGDVWLAASQEHFEVADQLGRQYSDDLRLMLDDLGWGAGDGRAIKLTTPPDVLRVSVAASVTTPAESVLARSRRGPRAARSSGEID